MPDSGATIARRRSRPVGHPAINGSPDVPAPSATFDRTELFTLRIAPDGTVRESEPAVPVGSSADPDAVGYRLKLNGSKVPAGSTVSARLTIGGIEEPAYNADKRWQAGSVNVQLDLLTPYGKAKYQVQASGYSLQVYLDGATMTTLDWSVPTVRPPALRMSLADLRQSLASAGWFCQQSSDEKGQRLDSCGAKVGGALVSAFLTSDPASGALVLVQLDVRAEDGTSSVVSAAHQLFHQVLEQLYGTAERDDLYTWIEPRGPEFGQILTRGTWLQSQGEADAHRLLTILPG
jgi:hypothetical protein